MPPHYMPQSVSATTATLAMRQRTAAAPHAAPQRHSEYPVAEQRHTTPSAKAKHESTAHAQQLIPGPAPQHTLGSAT
jgi:hypothetical protein